MTKTRRLNSAMMIIVVSLAATMIIGLVEQASCHDHHNQHQNFRHHHPPNVQYSSSLNKQKQQQQSPTEEQSSDSISTNNSDQIRVVSGPSGRRAIKYCADLSPLKEFLTTQIEPYYTPIIGLLPENVQLVLLDESSFGGFTTASFVLLTSCFLLGLLGWFATARYMQTSAENSSACLNEQLLALKLALNQANLKTNTFEHEIVDLQNRLKESDVKLQKANERLENFSTSNNMSSKEVEKLRQNEARAIKELNVLKLELAETRDKFERERSEFEAQTAELNRQLSEQQHNQQASVVTTTTDELILKEQLVRELREENEKLREQEARLREELSAAAVARTTHDDHHSHHSHHSSPAGGDLAEVMTRLIETEQKLEAKEKENAATSVSLTKLQDELRASVERQQEIEKQLKESEMQIKILNDLREKDTQRHVKSMADLDNQLKKKNTEAEKNSLLMEQMRVKQERIHELEQQFAKIERQSTSERQAHEKQAHETWLQMRKIERELKDVRAELASARERLVDSETQLKTAQSENQAMKQTIVKYQQQQTANYYMPSPGSRRSVGDPNEPVQNDMNEASLTGELRIDTTNGHQQGSRPASSASSSSGGVNGHKHLQQGPSPNNNQYGKYPTPPLGPMLAPFPMMYPPQASPNGLMPPGSIPYNQSPQHIMMMKMMMHQQQAAAYQKHLASMAAAGAAAAKASPSPNGSQASPYQHHMSYSATFPNGNSTSFLNDSSSNANSLRGSSIDKEETSSSSKAEVTSDENNHLNNNNNNNNSHIQISNGIEPTNLASNFDV